MKKFPTLLFFLVTFFIFSCAKKEILKINYSNDVLLKRILKENKQICDVKGRYYIFYEDRFFKVKFKCALIKTCNNSLKIFIYGFLNQILAVVDYDGNKVVVLEKGKDVSKDYSQILSKDNLNRIINLLKIPSFLPKSIVRKIIEDNYLYLYDNKNILYKIDEEFKIVEIKTDKLTISYKYKNDLIKEIKYVDSTTKLFIRVL